ncbi:MAG TPA: non-canonical purine NTP pyrophosphatase [Verrucomicrobiae bacterium]|nr:non-canonical purine NTP pyrophosphatase [Verrucomicrobiae bacterium]
MITLIIATRNPHKVDEIRAILGTQFECLSLNAFPGAPEVVEDSGTFAGNATKKAVQLAKWISRQKTLKTASGSVGQIFVLADDSGLEVDALGGAPGVHSARFAALDTGKQGNSSAQENNSKLLRLLANVPAESRTARFKCVLALTPVLPPEPISSSPACSADEFEFNTRLFEGACEGRIGFELRGSGGFGYDPLFFPERHDKTFGELTDTEKNRLSHRARALAGLVQAFNLRPKVTGP